MLKFIARTANQFVNAQSLGGVLLALAAVVALLVSNSPWAEDYLRFLQIPGEVRIGAHGLVLAKPLLVWVNDLWMAVFFFLVGLEIKRELLEGELASGAQALLPAGVDPQRVRFEQGDAMALREQHRHERRAQITGAAGHEYVVRHVRASPFLFERRRPCLPRAERFRPR